MVRVRLGVRIRVDPDPNPNPNQATLVVLNRVPTARSPVEVRLRATCIWVKHGGRLLAGRPALPTSFAPDPTYLYPYP